MTLRLAETEREHWARRIREDATKPPIVLARRVVQRHIDVLRERGLVTARPDCPGLTLAREALEHAVAAAILDARKGAR
jgi:DNA-binding transcriptional ArsR family regulator